MVIYTKRFKKPKRKKSGKRKIFYGFLLLGLIMGGLFWKMLNPVFFYPAPDASPHPHSNTESANKNSTSIIVDQNALRKHVQTLTQSNPPRNHANPAALSEAI